jgi:hypothetical protein
MVPIDPLNVIFSVSANINGLRVSFPREDENTFRFISSILLFRLELRRVSLKVGKFLLSFNL